MSILMKSASRGLFCNCYKTQRIFLNLSPLQLLLLRNSSSANNNKKAISTSQDRLHRIISKSRILSRLNKQPRFTHYFDRLSEAGLTSTLTSFFVLHELTAIAPLFALWYIFYRLDLPEQYELPVYFTDALNQCGAAIEKLVGDKYNNDFDHNRLILAGAISYAIVKLLYPLRVLVSLWGAPYMGRWLLSPFRSIKSKLKGKASKASK
ncbi:uncharacterized protein ZBIST_2767 [Zygosaccharomyces bailii]|nr:uncharacterized protein ZBIST_2767 [Zygosaccharomyces bailii]